MRDKNLDEVEVRCPICLKVWPGKYINNPYENQGICDWCALGLMINDPGTEAIVASN